MLSKTTLAMVAAGAIFGAASAAQAGGSKNDAGGHGGSDIGPLGQCFNPPDCDADADQQGVGYGYARGAYAYAGAPYAYARAPYVYSRPYPPGWHYTLGYGWHYGRP